MSNIEFSRGAVVSTTLCDEWSYPLHMSGSASTLPAGGGSDIIDALHDAVESVTGERPQKLAVRPIGFLWSE